MHQSVIHKHHSKFFLDVRLKDIKILSTLKVIFEFTLRSMLIVAVIVTAVTVLTSNTDKVFGIRSYTVLTGSMEPTLPVGSIIYTKSNLGYNIGDIITFKNLNGTTITHRVAAVENNGQIIYRTRGDANRVSDQGFITADQIIGKTYFSLPFIGKVSAMLKTPQGLFMSVFLPAMFIILYELWIIKKEIEKGVEKRLLKKLQEQGGVPTHSLWQESTS